MADHKTRKSYPRLAEMGVLHPSQISWYSVSSLDYVDYLRLVYERPKGSILPVSRTYRFPRVQKTLKAKAGETPTVVMESSPEFLEVLRELEGLVQTKATAEDITETMLDELRCLGEDVSSHLDNLRTLLDKVKDLS